MPNASPADITVPAVRIVLCVLLPFACLVTYFRLYIRYTRGKLWWDDFWAFVCTLCAIVFVAAAMLHVQTPGSIPHNAEISIYYMCAQFFYAVVWTARISIMFTVIRLSFGQMRRFLFGIVILFFITWTILFAQVWWVCERQPGWKDLLVPQCELGTNVAIAQLLTDVLSDVILIGAPMRLLWRVQLERGLKLRLRAVFLTTSIGTAVSLYHAYCVLKFGGLLEFLAATIQLAVNLIVVNLPVLVAVVFRLKADESDNVEPLSGIVTIGSARNRRNPATTTFGGTTTTMGGSEAGTKLNVHIVQTNTQWGDSTKIGTVDDFGRDTHELKSISNNDAFSTH